MLRIKESDHCCDKNKKSEKQRNKAIFQISTTQFWAERYSFFFGFRREIDFVWGIRKTKEEKNENDHGNKITKFGELGFHFVAPNLQENWGII